MGPDVGPVSVLGMWVRMQVQNQVVFLFEILVCHGINELATFQHVVSSLMWCPQSPVFSHGLPWSPAFNCLIRVI